MAEIDSDEPDELPDPSEWLAHPRPSKPLWVENLLFAGAPWKDGSAPSGNDDVATYKRMALAELLREHDAVDQSGQAVTSRTTSFGGRKITAARRQT